MEFLPCSIFSIFYEILIGLTLELATSDYGPHVLFNAVKGGKITRRDRITVIPAKIFPENHGLRIHFFHPTLVV